MMILKPVDHVGLPCEGSLLQVGGDQSKKGREKIHKGSSRRCGFCPYHPLERAVFDVLQPTPRSCLPNEVGLEQASHVSPSLRCRRRHSN
jgi:hypothetical protein